jgi:hypothetical protein
MTFDRTALSQDFDEAIDRLEAALRACPDDLWEASLWEVKRSDPWIWPKSGEPEPGRTDETIQVFSAVWLVAYHCLFYLDFYTTTDMASFETPTYIRGGVEEDPINEHGTAKFPDPVYPRELLLRYLEHGRARVRNVIETVSEEQLAERCPPGHPWQGTTLADLLRVNLTHVREHGGQIAEFIASQQTSVEVDDKQQTLFE